MADYTQQNNGGEMGIMDGQLDWGGKGGKLWECWVVEPCCDGYCCATWWCCGSLNACQLFAWSLDQPCSFVNHCLPFCFVPMGCFLRYAIRQKLGIAAGGPQDGWVGDCLIACCCGSCSMCQEIRGSHLHSGKQSWDFFGAGEKLVPMSEPFKSFPPFTPMA